VGCHEVNQHAVEAEDAAEIGAAQAHAAREDSLEYRLDIRRRATDYLQNLARRRLLFQRFGDLRVRLCQRLILLLKLGEGADVLDRDDGLVGESLEELSLFGREGPNVRAANDDRTDR